MSTDPAALSESNRKKVALCVSHYLDQLAIALKTKVPKERALLYLRALSDLSAAQIDHGFDLALKKFIPGYGIDFPAPAMIRDWALTYVSPGVTDEVLARPAKPPDWEPGLAEQLVAEMREKLKAGALTMPAYRETAESLAKERNPESTIPEDKEERRPWATKKAKSQGWL